MEDTERTNYETALKKEDKNKTSIRINLPNIIFIPEITNE